MKYKPWMLNAALALCAAYMVACLMMTSNKVEARMARIRAVSDQLQVCDHVTIPATKDEISMVMGKPVREERVQSVMGPATRVYFRYQVPGIPDPWFDIDDTMRKAVAMDCQGHAHGERRVRVPEGFNPRAAAAAAALPTAGPRQ